MPKRTDANQSLIVSTYRDLFCSVTCTHELGDGFPDLVVGIPTSWGGSNELVEVKDGEKPPSKRKLTPDEQDFHDEWRGKKPVIIESVNDVIAHVRAVQAGA